MPPILSRWKLEEGRFINIRSMFILHYAYDNINCNYSKNLKSYIYFVKKNIL